jgi:hypothetical protein
MTKAWRPEKNEQKYTSQPLSDGFCFIKFSIIQFIDFKNKQPLTDTAEQ